MRASVGADAAYTWPWHRTNQAFYNDRMRLTSILILFVVVFALFASVAGCVVRTGPSYRTRQARSCPPAHHWDGYGCVHNGNGKHKGHR
jgi:hypothetical protein